MKTYRSRQVLNMTGLTMRKLDWMDKTGVVVPRRAPIQRHNRRYTERDVMFLRLVLYLRNLGYSLWKCRVFLNRIREMIREHPVDLRGARLILFGVRKKWLMLTEGKFVLSMENTPVATSGGASYRHIEVVDLTYLWPGQERKVGRKEADNKYDDSGDWTHVGERSA